MKTVISHFYNEEYLLPFWLKHHRQFFDHGIMINYASTDKSVEIIKELCPTWDVVDSRNKYFDRAGDIDDEVQSYELELDGWRMALNIPEFLIGNYKLLDTITQPTQLIVASYLMTDTIEQTWSETPVVDLFKERTNGIDWRGNNYENFHFRSARSLHNHSISYKVPGGGRHYSPITTKLDLVNGITDEFIILWYGRCPLNEATVQRKLQERGKRAPNTGNVDPNREEVITEAIKWQEQSIDLQDIISKFLNLQKYE